MRRLRRYARRDAPAGPLILGLSLVLLGWGLFQAVSVGQVYFDGERGTGIVVRANPGDTRLRVGEAECPVPDGVGAMGRSVPVAFPHGHPRDCVVRRPGAFKWAAGAMLLGGAIVAMAIFMMRDAAQRRGDGSAAG